MPGDAPGSSLWATVEGRRTQTHVPALWVCTKQLANLCCATLLTLCAHHSEAVRDIHIYIYIESHTHTHIYIYIAHKQHGYALHWYRNIEAFGGRTVRGLQQLKWVRPGSRHLKAKFQMDGKCVMLQSYIL